MSHSSLFLLKNSTEAVVQRCSVYTKFLKISQNSQESSVAESSFNKLQTSGLKIFKYTFFNRTPLVAAFYSKIIYFPFPRFLYALIIKQVKKQMFLGLDGISDFQGTTHHHF